jgi:hypothetical protein
MDSLQLIITIILSVVFLIIGLFGNLISLFIYNNKEFKNHSATIYFKFICILNIIIVLIISPYGMAPIIFDLNIINCKINTVLIVIFPEIKSWVLAICSLDRFISFIAPSKLLLKNNFKFQVSLLAFVIIFFGILTFPYGYYMNISENENETVCSVPQDKELTWVFEYFKIEYFFFRTIFPFTIIIITSIIIGWRMYRRKALLSQNPNRKREEQFIKSLIAMDLSFIIFRLPLIFYILITYKGETSVAFDLNYTIFNAISSLNAVISVFIFLSFNKKFHELFLKYVCFNKFQNRVDIIS